MSEQIQRHRRRSIMIAAGLAFLCGVAIIACVDSNFRPNVDEFFPILPVLAAAGGATMGHFCFGFFGENGAFGWGRAAFGYLVATTGGAAIAGTFFAPVLGTIGAPAYLYLTLIEVPPVLIIWIASGAAFQFYCIKTIR